MNEDELQGLKRAVIVQLVDDARKLFKRSRVEAIPNKELLAVHHDLKVNAVGVCVDLLSQPSLSPNSKVEHKSSALVKPKAS